MAEWPASGNTDWNTKMLAYLAIEHETDGTHSSSVTNGLIKAWVRFTIAGTISDSFNVTSVVKDATGKYTITWDTDFANGNYAIVAMIAGAVGGQITWQNAVVGSVKIFTYDKIGALADKGCNVIAIGDQ